MKLQPRNDKYGCGDRHTHKHWTKQSDDQQ